MYLGNIIRSKSDLFLGAVKITDVISKNAVQVHYPRGRGSNVSARDLAPSSECYSNTALNEEQDVVTEEPKNTNSINETITVDLLENADISNSEVSKVHKKARPTCPKKRTK